MITIYSNNSSYDEDLKRRQKEHLDSIKKPFENIPCMHDSCPECIGTGVKKDGLMCFHWIACNCPKCTPYF